ncbi:MAG: Stk1 family PASTA domain-containing Ser/Thr kinase [Actinomycetota bacterium]|nr:Stk1 family PASTA domain-containing Ser/Thr kinase [Actinomycetota bacterium]
MTVSDTLINTLFDGRYRILRRIGSGGMANVYVAEDEELGRRVAIKILNDRYANDDLSNERFRREAKSAAALSHPNIVSIYDRGESNGIPYIAMEMIEGRSLKEVILARGPLSVSQAIDYAEQILDALRFAHRHGIIHRDIKPHNILIGPEGRLKVTDFGIARAGFSQMTEAGSIMGTAQYLSPEQARGAPVTAASDLYSVGIVLYEMVTGEVPFDGHSPIEIAMKHVNETPRPPSDVNPDVPRELDQIVLRALAKDPHDRYQTAELFSEDLERLEAGVPVSPETAAAATTVLTGAPATAATQVLAPDAATRTLPARRTTDRRPAYPPEYGYREPPRKRRRLVPWLLVLLLLGAAAAAGWYVFSRVREEIAESKPVAVPLVIGLRQEQAREQIEKVGLEAEVKRAASTRQPRGRVFDQDPKVGTEVAKGTKVTLRVSTGPPMAEVPRLVGLDKDRAIEMLDKRELKWNLQEVFSERPLDEVVGQKPKPGERVVEASVVTLTVSKGQEPVSVPNVVGMPREQAEAALTANGFDVTRETVPSDEDKGIVVDQDPGAGAAVPKGSTVTIEVSEGPRTTSVPDVVGESRKDAERKLGQAGFGVRVRVEPTTDPAADGHVVDQNPAGGVQADPGSTVTIAVGEFVPPPTTTG